VFVGTTYGGVGVADIESTITQPLDVDEEGHDDGLP
jgi:hypothetical protein